MLNSGEGLLSTAIYIYKDRKIYALETESECQVAAFCQDFRAKKEINHAVDNLAKIWHHMWHWGHKCNCFGNLSMKCQFSEYFNRKIYSILWDF